MTTADIRYIFFSAASNFFHENLHHVLNKSLKRTCFWEFSQDVSFFNENYTKCIFSNVNLLRKKKCIGESPCQKMTGPILIGTHKTHEPVGPSSPCRLWVRGPLLSCDNVAVHPGTSGRLLVPGYRLHPPCEMMSDVICQRRAWTTSGHTDARPWSNYNACSPHTIAAA